MTRIQYFSRCNGEVVQLHRVDYALHAVQLCTVAYPAQTQFVRNSRNSPTCDRAAVDSASPWAFLYAVGICAACGLTHAADRLIDRGTSPSGHRCDARCMYAKGHICECSCGGKYHGAGDFILGQSTLFGLEVSL